MIMSRKGVEMYNKLKAKKIVIPVIMAMILMITGCSAGDLAGGKDQSKSSAKSVESVENVEEYSGEPYTVINDNQPDFDESELTTKSYEEYSELDELGRCGVATANVSKDTMPTEKRGAIGQVKPSGWHTARYDSVIKDKYLYNRCHLIGYQLTGENANEENLITGTRYLNIDGMLSFEDEVADYVKSTGNHVLYRVTPVFEGDNLVASGVQMEAMSVEDDGEGVCFNVYAYNVQPHVVIDYETGDSHLDSETATKEEEQSSSEGTYICNTNTKKFHRPTCSSVDDMSDKYKKKYKGKAQSLIDNGYSPCKNCNP